MRLRQNQSEKRRRFYPKYRRGVRVNIDEYLNKYSEEQQAFLQNILDWVDENFPELKLEVKWNQPMYVHEGTYIIGFSLSKAHVSVSPEQHGMEVFHDKVAAAGYSQSKMLFRIKYTEEVDYELLREMIEYNIKDKAGSAKFWR